MVSCNMLHNVLGITIAKSILSSIIVNDRSYGSVAVNK